MLKKLAAVVAWLSVWLLTEPLAHAALLPHHDLTSLAFQSTHVVRARTLSERKIDPYTNVRTMTVLASYAGDLAVGSTFTVSIDGYSLVPIEELWNPSAKKAVLGDDMILFLTRAKPDPTHPLPAELLVTASGLRIFRDGRAYRFAQINNPGGYYPVPQGLDPWDQCDGPGARATVDRKGLEAQIAVALRRADEVRRALGALTTPESRRALAGLVGPVTDLGDAPPCYDDEVAQAILSALGKAGDLRALLDAASRTTESRTSMSSAPEADLLGAARDTSLPRDSRVAALSLLRARVYPGLRDSSLEPPLLALFSDREPRVRGAALLVGAAPTPVLRSAIGARWSVEKDPRVRVALVRAAAQGGLRDDLKTPGAAWPAFAVYAANDRIFVVWADVEPDVNLELSSLELTMRRDGQASTASLTPDLRTMTGAGMGLFSAPIVFSPPLAPGSYEGEVSLTLNDASSKRSSVTKTVAIGPLLASGTPPPPNVIAPPAAPASFGPPVAPSSSAPAPAPLALPRPRSGCGCHAAGREGSPAPKALLLLLALVVARRSHRSGPHETSHSSLAPRPRRRRMREPERSGERRPGRTARVAAKSRASRGRGP